MSFEYTSTTGSEKAVAHTKFLMNCNIGTED